MKYNARYKYAKHQSRSFPYLILETEKKIFSSIRKQIIFICTFNFFYLKQTNDSFFKISQTYTLILSNENILYIPRLPNCIKWLVLHSIQ